MTEPDEESHGEVVNPPAPPVPASEISGMLMQIRSESFEGPLPHPEVLERYAALYPDAPRVIIRAFESQTKHRMEMEAAFVHEQNKRIGRGQILGSCLIGIGLIAGVVALVLSESVAGSTIIVACVAGGVLSFVFGYPKKS